MAKESLLRRLAATPSADDVGHSCPMGTDEAGAAARLTALRRGLIDQTSLLIPAVSSSSWEMTRWEFLPALWTPLPARSRSEDAFRRVHLVAPQSIFRRALSLVVPLPP